MKTKTVPIELKTVPQELNPVGARVWMLNVSKSKDIEMAHILADKVLCALLHNLASLMSEDDARDIIRLVDQFNAIKKWYA